MGFLAVFLLCLAAKDKKAKRHSIRRSPTGHRINRDGRIVNSKGKIL